MQRASSPGKILAQLKVEMIRPRYCWPSDDDLLDSLRIDELMRNQTRYLGPHQVG